MSRTTRSRNSAKSRCVKCGAASSDGVGAVAWCQCCNHSSKRGPTSSGARVHLVLRKITDDEFESHLNAKSGAAGGTNNA